MPTEVPNRLSGSPDWKAWFPILNMSGAFRMAVSAPRLLLALLMVIVIFIGGQLLDSVWGKRALTGSFAVYVNNPDNYAQALEAHREQIGLSMAALIPNLEDAERQSLVEKHNLLDLQAVARTRIVNGYEKLIDDAASDEVKSNIREQREAAKQTLDDIVDQSFSGIFEVVLMQWRGTSAAIRDFVPNPLAQGPVPPEGRFNRAFIGLERFFADVPVWLLRTHPGFAALFLPLILLSFAFIGGSVARMHAVHATRDQRISALDAVAYARRYFVWFVLTPLIPLVVPLFLGILVMVGAFLLVNVPGLDFVGGLLYPLALGIGLIMAIMLLLLAAGGGLLYPALAVEGTDGFDAISRSFNYVITRPWRWLAYSLVGFAYSAITIVVVLWLIGLAIDVSHFFIESGTVVEVDGQDRFRVLLGLAGDSSEMNIVSRAAGTLLAMWLTVFKFLVPAFIINIFLATHTWIYLLLRKSTDGSGFDDVYLPAEAEAVTNGQATD